MLTRLRALGPYAKGILGALLVLMLYVGEEWTRARWNEFVIMRSVVSQILEQQQRQQQTQQAAHPAPAKPQPETEAK